MGTLFIGKHSNRYQFLPVAKLRYWKLLPHHPNMRACMLRFRACVAVEELMLTLYNTKVSQGARPSSKRASSTHAHTPPQGHAR